MIKKSFNIITHFLLKTVQSVIDESNLKPHLVHVMQEILKQPNLPRKQVKFEVLSLVNFEKLVS